MQNRLTGPSAFLSTLFAMAGKELTIMLRYPVEFVASFGQVFLIVATVTLAGLMFSPQVGANNNSATAGVVVYGFVIFMFLSDTLWTIGYNVRRDQKQGTLEQLYLSPASKFANLLSRISVTLVWTGLLCVMSAVLMSALIGDLPVHNLPLALGVLALTLSGTFGFGFAFAALTLRIKESAQTLINVIQFSFMVVCAPFYPFAALPEWARAIATAIPLSHGVDAFRSVLMGLPTGYPELAPIEVELAVVAVFGLVMPVLGYWLYRHEEDVARRAGSLSEY
ncbi:MAG TPA: ABC transporter permease [Anaerolineales bacterium]|nr:ABC transporter permease [Anaerolineales bacterium]